MRPSAFCTGLLKLRSSRCFRTTANATLDVFRDEPLPLSHPFWHHPRITVTPHVSAATLVTESAAQVAAKIRALERGERISGRVDHARGH